MLSYKCSPYILVCKLQWRLRAEFNHKWIKILNVVKYDTIKFILNYFNYNLVSYSNQHIIKILSISPFWVTLIQDISFLLASGLCFNFYLCFLYLLCCWTDICFPLVKIIKNVFFLIFTWNSIVLLICQFWMDIKEKCLEIVQGNDTFTFTLLSLVPESCTVVDLHLVPCLWEIFRSFSIVNRIYHSVLIYLKMSFWH